MSAAKKRPSSARTKTKTRPTTKKPAPRADYGAPIDGFFAKQAPAMRTTLEALRALVEKAAPEATSSIKWGMPFYAIGDATVCALGAHKSHINLILAGEPGTFVDPKGLLEGDGKTGRRLKLAPGDAIPTADVEAWLKAAVKRARTA